MCVIGTNHSISALYQQLHIVWVILHIVNITNVRISDIHIHRRITQLLRFEYAVNFAIFNISLIFPIPLISYKPICSWIIVTASYLFNIFNHFSFFLYSTGGERFPFGVEPNRKLFFTRGIFRPAINMHRLFYPAEKTISTKRKKKYHIKCKYLHMNSVLIALKVKTAFRAVSTCRAIRSFKTLIKLLSERFINSTKHGWGISRVSSISHQAIIIAYLYPFQQLFPTLCPFHSAIHVVFRVIAQHSVSLSWCFCSGCKSSIEFR